jgi:serine/threonine protein kinase
MEPHTWDRIQEVYYLALPLSATERIDFVARECGYDPFLTREICSLLQADESDSRFLEAPVFELGLRVIHSDPRTLSTEVTDPADELVGSTVDGRYVVGNRLAVGGMARVYVARDLRLHQRRVVVKVLLDESLRNEWVVQKFQQEREALARVDHPGVVNILDAGELPDKTPYLVMQYVDGVSLREMIATNPEGIEFPRAASIIRGIGAALNAVHEKKIYHRDLKPENIMLQRLGPAEEHVKILDFGIAKVKESLIGPSTMTGAGTMGTIAYMSPEQLRGDRVAAASDLYSFATMAFEILTGRRPFVSDTPAHLAEMQRQGVRAKPADLRPRLPEEAEAIILNGLAFEARARSLSASEFGDRLSRALLAGEDDGFEQEASSGRSREAAATPDLATKLDSIQSPRASSATAQTQETTFISDEKSRPERWLVFAVAAVLIIGAMTGSYWLISRNGSLFGKSANSRPGSSSPHRTLTYSLTVQKMRNGLPYQDPFESSGQEIFENGYKFRLNVSSRQAGYLYVFNEGAPEKDHTNFTIIYPTPVTNEGSARLEQNQNMQTNWNTFLGEAGTERFWIIWSATAVTQLEIARHEAFKNTEGALTDSTVAGNVRDFLLQHSDPKPETTKDTAKQRTNVSAGGDVLVKLVELEHR